MPLGYDYSPEEKKLKVNSEEAKILKLIFDTYLKEKFLAKVVEKINSLVYNPKLYPTKTGKPIGGGELDHPPK